MTMLGRYNAIRENALWSKPYPGPIDARIGLGEIDSDEGTKLMGQLVKTLAIGLAVGIALKIAMKMVAARI